MEDKSLIEKEVSSELKLKIELKDSKLVLSALYDGKGVDAGMHVSVDPDYFLDQLKAAIPGQIDDTVIDLLRAAFKVA